MLSEPYILLRIAFVILNIGSAFSLHINGQWTNADLGTILVKFGFQKIDSLNQQHTLGFVYGNITDHDPTLYHDANKDHRVLLVLITQSNFPQFYHYLTIVEQYIVNHVDPDRLAQKSRSSVACQQLLSDLSEHAFESHCFWNGTQDFFRSIPCPSGKLCADEDNPSKVLPNYQFTFRVQELVLPGFWYLALVSCCLDAKCAWRRQPQSVTLNYDIWLVNGSPLAKYANPFEHQFSFDNQDTAEIYLCAMALFLGLCILQYQAGRILSGGGAVKVPPRSRYLFYIFTTQMVSILFLLIHTLVFAVNGTGVTILQWTGEIVWVFCVNLLTIFIILFARGWSIITHEVSSKRFVIGATVVLLSLHTTFFIWNSQAVNEFEEIDIYQTWPGWGIMLLRVVCMVWFIAEIRHTVARCLRRQEEHKAAFLTHFGAGFLVWLVHIPVLGLLCSKVSLLWRFKLILGVTYMADFLAGAILLHLLWPRSTNRRFFLPDQVNHPFGGQATLNSSSLMQQDELDDYERELIGEEIVPLDPINDNSL